MGLPSIMSSAINSSFRNPSTTATGTNTAASPTVFSRAATSVGTSFLMALAPSKLAPMDSSARGVVTEARLFNVLVATAGRLTGSSANTVPVIMPSKIGLVATPFSNCFSEGAPFCSGDSSIRISTAKMLNSGTLPSIISGAMPAVP